MVIMVMMVKRGSSGGGALEAMVHGGVGGCNKDTRASRIDR